MRSPCTRAQTRGYSRVLACDNVTVEATCFLPMKAVKQDPASSVMVASADAASQAVVDYEALALAASAVHVARVQGCCGCCCCEASAGSPRSWQGRVCVLVCRPKGLHCAICEVLHPAELAAHDACGHMLVLSMYDDEGECAAICGGPMSDSES